MELGNGDPSAAAGIAQWGPRAIRFCLPTPSLQTNFSPASLAFWQEVYLEMAGIQAAAGLQPYLQFGEVQWWYFPNDGDRPSHFRGCRFTMRGIRPVSDGVRARDDGVYDNTVDPAAYPDEVAFLQTVIGNFTDAIMTFVRATYSHCAVRSAVSERCQSDRLQSGDQLSAGRVDSGRADVSEDRELRIHARAAIWTRLKQTIDVRDFAGISRHTAEPSGGRRRFDHGVAERGSVGAGQRDSRAWCCLRWTNSA